MTGEADWDIIRGPDGGVMGVASKSQAKTIKRANFDLADFGFNDGRWHADVHVLVWTLVGIG